MVSQCGMCLIENRGKRRQQRLLLSTVSPRTGTTEGRLCKHRQPQASLVLVSTPYTLLYDHTTTQLLCLHNFYIVFFFFFCLAWERFIQFYNGPFTNLNKMCLKIVVGWLGMSSGESIFDGSVLKNSLPNN